VVQHASVRKPAQGRCLRSSPTRNRSQLNSDDAWRITGYAEVILILDLPLLPACRQYTQNLFDMLNSWLPSASGDISRARAALRLTGASAIHVRCMDKLTVDAVREIEQIHSSWIEFEVAGEDHSLMALCADDIELWPPDAQPVLGRAAVSAQLVRSTTRIYAIEITDRRIRGSNEIAYLTASYKTTFSSAQDSTRSDKPSEAICGYWRSGPVSGLLLSSAGQCGNLPPLLRLGYHPHPAPDPRKHASRITPDRGQLFLNPVREGLPTTREQTHFLRSNRA
jgi:ketosteroid isomerase-like protein